MTSVLSVLTGGLQHPISQSVCGESVRSGSHSRDDASLRFPQSQVHLCEFWKKKKEINKPACLSLLLSLCATFLLLPPALPLGIIFCITSSETATSPWWLGSAAPDLQFAGWIEPRTNQCCACAKPPREHVRRWEVRGELCFTLF